MREEVEDVNDRSREENDGSKERERGRQMREERGKGHLTLESLSGRFFLKSAMEESMKGTRYVRTLCRAARDIFLKARITPTITVLAMRSSESAERVRDLNIQIYIACNGNLCS